jgi:hypothetical protein
MIRYLVSTYSRVSQDFGNVKAKIWPEIAKRMSGKFDFAISARINGIH